MAVQPGLCRTWSEIPKTGFLKTRLISRSEAEFTGFSFTCLETQNTGFNETHFMKGLSIVQTVPKNVFIVNLLLPVSVTPTPVLPFNKRKMRSNNYLFWLDPRSHCHGAGLGAARCKKNNK